MIDESYCGPISKKLDAKTKKYISKEINFTLTEANLYIDLISPKKQLIEAANNDVNTHNAPVHEKRSMDHLIVAQTNTSLVARDVINENR